MNKQVDFSSLGEQFDFLVETNEQTINDSEKWHTVNEQPQLHENIDMFSDELLVKVKSKLSGMTYYMVAYKNATSNEWFNPLIEEVMQDEIMEWKYIK